MLEKFVPKLSWDAVLQQFDNLIKHVAKQQVMNNERNDGMVSAEDIYQEGLMKLYDCWNIWCVDPQHDKDMDEFGAIFKKSLYRVASKKGTPTKVRSLTVDLVGEDGEDGIYNIKDGNTEDVVERMYREYGVQHLMDILTSDVAKRLLAELIEPSLETLWHVQADIKRKEMIKSQIEANKAKGIKDTRRVNVPKDNTVRMKHIQRALGITTKQYDTAMKEIRANASIALNY
jgi:hypothetical protein